MAKRVLLYEVNLSAKYADHRSRVERVLKTAQEHPWSGKLLYGLYRYYSNSPAVLFVPTRSQMIKIRARKGVIRIYSDQTKSGTGLGL